MNDIKDMDTLRKSCETAGFDESELAEDPIEMFENWFSLANKLAPGKWFEPNAMTLSTTDNNGHVAGRIVLLKKIDSQGFYFFTNYSSAKGKQLDQCPNAALTLHWPYLGRQVRIVGAVVKTDHATSEEYFHSRNRGSQVSAVVSEQSSVLSSRTDLESKYAEVEKKYEGMEIPLPDYWGGYLLTPESIEFWQGRENRMHDRFRYSRAGKFWKVDRLSP